MTVDKWHNIFQLLGILSVLVALVSGIGAYCTGRVVFERDSKIEEQKDGKIRILDAELKSEKKKLRSFIIDTSIKFKINWKDIVTTNTYAGHQRASSFCQLIGTNNQEVTLNQISLPNFNKEVGSNSFTFRTSHEISSSAPLNHKIEELYKFNKIRFSIPFLSLKFDKTQTVEIESVRFTIKLNGKSLPAIQDNNSTSAPVVKLSDKTQGYAVFDMNIVNPDVLFQL